MLEKLTEDELILWEGLHDPVCIAECLFHNFDDLATYDEEEFGEIRLYQYPLLSFDMVIDEEPNLSKKENFECKKVAGSLIALASRRFGKTKIAEEIDLLIYMPHAWAEQIIFSSYDAIHVRGVLDSVFNVLDKHPFYQIYEPHVRRSPDYTATLKNGCKLVSVNMNIVGKKPGNQFFQKHAHRIYIEEASKLTEEVYDKMIHAVSELGAVLRLSGMTDFTRNDIPGQLYNDPSNRKYILNLPQFVNPFWDEKEKATMIREHGGEDSIPYRIFVLGEVVEEGLSVFNMDEVRANYDRDKKGNVKRKIVHYELTRDTFINYKHLIFVDRPINAKAVWIAADVGSVIDPTEITIFHEINDKYRYQYNITLYGLHLDNQVEFFRYIAEKLNANFIGVDATEAFGRELARSLSKIFGNENIIPVNFAKNINVDYKKDSKGNLIFKDGKLIPIEENCKVWSVKTLIDLFHNEKFNLPYSDKFERQINGIICVRSGDRVIYKCIHANDHLFDSFRVFAIMHFIKAGTNVGILQRKKTSTGIWG